MRKCWFLNHAHIGARVKEDPEQVSTTNSTYGVGRADGNWSFMMRYYLWSMIIDLNLIKVCCIMSKRESIPSGYVIIRQSAICCAGSGWMNERYWIVIIINSRKAFRLLLGGKHDNETSSSTFNLVSTTLKNWSIASQSSETNTIGGTSSTLVSTGATTYLLLWLLRLLKWSKMET